MNRFDRTLEAIGERMNPILVREVRRAMKGQIFMIAFMSVLLFAFLGTLFVMLTVWREARGGSGDLGEFAEVLEFAGSGGRSAQILFSGLFFLLSIAVTGIVPFLAFFSMNAERDESTLDLLSLASIRPGGIVRGKLFCLVMQALLFYAAITPFLAACFLMRGLSLEVFLVGMGLSVLLCAGLTSLGLLLSCLRVPKIARLALLILFGMLAYGANMAIVFGIGASAQNPGVVTQPEFQVTCSVAAGFLFFLTCFSLAFSPGQLAHLEENRSTAPRIATSVFVLLLILGNLGFQGIYIEREIRFVLQWLAFYLLCIPLTLFVSEPERLGRRITSKLPRFGVLSILITPWLPGGGRGMIFAILHIAVLFLAVPHLDPAWSLSSSFATGLTSSGVTLAPHAGIENAYQGFLITSFYILIFLGLGPALFSPWTKSALPRVFSGLSVPGLAILAFFVMTLVRTASVGTYSPEEHWANPFLVPMRVFNAYGDNILAPTLSIISAGFLIVLLLNLKRMILGLAEVMRASKRPAPKSPSLPSQIEGANA